MKQSEIQVGELYQAKVSGVIVIVRVDAIRVARRVGGGARRSGQLSVGKYTVYDITNLRTGKQLVFKSAMKFCRHMTQDKLMSGLHNGEMAHALRGRSKTPLEVLDDALDTGCSVGSDR